MTTIRNITMVSAILAGSLLAPLGAAFAQDAAQLCTDPLAGPISHLVWNDARHAWMAPMIDLAKADPAVYLAPALTGPAAMNTSGGEYDVYAQFDEGRAGAVGWNTSRSANFDIGS